MDRRDFIFKASAAAAVLLPAGRAVADPDNDLGALRAITIAAPDVDAIQAAYARYLGFQTVGRGSASLEAAQSWGAPQVAGRKMAVMLPASGAPPYLRFVEQPLAADFRPLTTFGWTAAEFLVQDPDQLAERLAASPFRIIGPPMALSGFPSIKAMQVVGPAGEVLYFTHFAPNPERPRAAPVAKTFVDACFVAVVAAADMEAQLAYYQNTFGNAPGRPFEIVNPILTEANGLAAGTRHRLATVSLGGAKVIEVDQLPANARPRVTPAGGLAPGIAMATFGYARLDRSDLNWIGRAAPSGVAPNFGARTATVRGGAGELIELAQG